MKRFLALWAISDDEFGLSVTDTAFEGLSRYRGRTSPLLSASPQGSPPVLASEGVLALLVPRRASELMAALMNDVGDEFAQRSYISHGHACAVVSCSNLADAERLVSELGPYLAGHELWPYRQGVMLAEDIVFELPAAPPTWVAPAQIRHEELGFEAAAQIRQFNGNMAVFSQHAAMYASELQPLVDWLHSSIEDIATELYVIYENPELDGAQVRRSITLESVLVEVNAILTLYCSQLGSGAVPIFRATYPVGEYSLLGIGSMCREVWRIYSHLNETFAKFDHVGRIQRCYAARPAFDPFEPSARINFGSWYRSNVGVADLDDGISEGFRYHMPVFSSRWGFHESLHSISLSWQCIYAAATKEWNLLTLTHEFLHAHVRDIWATTFEVSDDASLRELLARYNARESGTNALHSMQVAFVEALVGLNGCSRLAQTIRGGTVEDTSITVPERLTEQSLRMLVQSHRGMFHEIVVHVLDYLYVYDSQDANYVNSLWSSWSLIPSVNERTEHYLLRTICALSADGGDTAPSEDVFKTCVTRLKRQLTLIEKRARLRPVIGRAIAILDDETALKRLGIEFKGARYVVHIAKAFFYDPELNASLIRDTNTTIREGRTTYALNVGDYRGDCVESPVAFLLDRFGGYSDQGGAPEAEYETLWQMLQLS
ncbi:hypothetical protein [Rhodococcoides kroppenstedtii]|nr:hypothetical protein [Rhodococcus kroppenstedtii]MBT1190982.1 hypothetical protein [Rhodococcus kroppenstedtii]